MQPGFAAGFGNQLPRTELVYQELAERRKALTLAAQQQQQMEAWAATLQSPPAAALPQQGPPGMQARPQASPSGDPSYGLMAGPMSGTAMPPGPATGAPTMGGAPPMGAPSQASPPPTTPPAGGSPSPGAAAGGPQLPDPMVRLRQMMAEIKRANPRIDNLTAFGALQQGIAQMKGLVPEERINMQLELAQQKFQSTRDIAELRADLERMREVGRMDRAAAGNATRLEVVGQQQAGANARSAAHDDRVGAIRRELQGGAMISDDNARFLAERANTGDNSAYQGLGYGNNRARNLEKVLAWQRQLLTAEGGETPPGGQGAETASRHIDYMGAGQGARSTATQAARIGIASRELQKFIPPLLEASKAVNRTQFPNFNAVQMAAERGTGGEAVVRLVSQVNAVKNAYAQIAARGGQSTDDARKRADEVMNAAWSNGQIEAGAKQLMVEADTALSAAEEAKGDATARLRTGGQRPGTASAATSAGGPPVPAADYAGQTVQGPDGSTWTSDGTRWAKQQR